ncbi:endonuclease/exonuclease/phosphatase family protein [Sphingobacterium spiritivorum]|uniref:endonuclease/exonuclease/phosphatase family protein n=1 Tax=Sphingobacterium spiritivorum TaxID=258 RepID=UPI003DA5C37E
MYLQYPKLPKKRWIYLVIPISLSFLGWNMIRTSRITLNFNRSDKVAAASILELPASNAGSFSVLTYNIAGLPEPISSAVTPRASSIADIGMKINRYDVVNVQEDFNYNRELYNNGNEHPFRTETMGKVPFSDGLNTLSKYPISDVQRIRWKDCTGADCLTPKGFSVVSLQLAKDVFVDLYNIHANAQDTPDAAVARGKNMDQLASFIKEHSKDKAILLMGDFNAHYSFELDNVRNFIKETRMIDTWVYLENKGIVPHIDPMYSAGDILAIRKDRESIDKIMFRNSAGLHFIPESYVIENRLFTDRSGLPLSDHCAVSLSFSWERCH